MGVIHGWKWLGVRSPRGGVGGRGVYVVVLRLLGMEVVGDGGCGGGYTISTYLQETL